MEEYESIIWAAVAAKKLWRTRHPISDEQALEEDMAFGLYLFMGDAIETRFIFSLPGMKPLIDRLQYGVDRGFEYYMKDLETAVGTAPFARLRNLYDFRNTPEEEVIRSGSPANLLEAGVWCLLTTTTLQQAMMKAAGLKGIQSDKAVFITGSLGVLEYGSSDLPDEWRDKKLETELRKTYPGDDFLNGWK